MYQLFKRVGHTFSVLICKSFFWLVLESRTYLLLSVLICKIFWLGISKKKGAEESDANH